MKTLIVDDIKINLKVAKKLTQIYGEAVTSLNGSLAIDEFKKAFEVESPFDIILLDIMMPELSGFGVLEEIRNYEVEKGVDNDQRCKVVFVTAMSNAEEEIPESLYDAYDGIIMKPLNKTKISSVYKS